MIKHGPPGVVRKAMGNLLDAWGEREQRRIERRQAQPPKPMPCPRFFRSLEWFFGTFSLTARFITIPILFIWIVALLVQHTVQSIVLAFGLAALLSLSLFNTGRMLHERRENGRNWFTGRTRESS
jgi:hypothetical protein